MFVSASVIAHEMVMWETYHTGEMILNKFEACTGTLSENYFIIIYFKFKEGMFIVAFAHIVFSLFPSLTGDLLIFGPGKIPFYQNGMMLKGFKIPFQTFFE